MIRKSATYISCHLIARPERLIEAGEFSASLDRSILAVSSCFARPGVFLRGERRIPVEHHPNVIGVQSIDLQIKEFIYKIYNFFIKSNYTYQTKKVILSAQMWIYHFEIYDRVCPLWVIDGGKYRRQPYRRHAQRPKVGDL